MTAPRYADCRCGHVKGLHETELRPQCSFNRCECLGYRPAMSTQVQPPPATAPTSLRGLAEKVDVLDALLERGRGSSLKRTTNLAEKISGLVDELRNRLHEEAREWEAQREAREEAERKTARVAALKAELAELTGKPAKGKTVHARSYAISRGVFPCGVGNCADVRDTAVGAAAHRRSHRAVSS